MFPVAEIDDIELKKRARRRLVGAAALALLAAIVLPMVMDSEPAVPSRDIQVTMADRGADSRPIAPRASVLPPAPIEVPSPQPLDDEALGIEDDGRAVEPVIEPDPEPEPTPEPEPAPAPRAQPQPRPEPAPAPRAAAPAPSQTDEADRVRAILEGRAAAAAAASERQFVVQAAAFGDADKAAAMRDDLRGRGFNAFVEDAGAVTRVRIGPFASRADADAVAERLRALGIGGVVTNP